jgi:hypothetical protein
VKRKMQDKSVLKSAEEVFVFRGRGIITEDGGNLRSQGGIQ